MFLIRIIFSLELFLVYCYFLVHMCVIIYIVVLYSGEQFYYRTSPAVQPFLLMR